MGHVTGCLALDVDGTLTDSALQMPPAVAHRLESLQRDGWVLLFLTGRTFSLVKQPLSSIRVPFFLAAQQGSILLEMPDSRVLQRWQMPVAYVAELDAMAVPRGLATVVYGGWDWRDTAWTCPSALSDAHLEHIAYLESFGTEPWRSLSSWTELPCASVPLIKIFGDHQACLDLECKLKQDPCWHVSRIKDPFHSEYSLLLITHPKANKGEALRTFVELINRGRLPIIAAGNDNNDIALLKESDCAIAMEGSPPELLAVADIVAPPCHQEGIIDGINQAIEFLKSSKDF